MPVETTIQQKVILRSLERRPHNTVEFREMDILSPAPRLLELRDMGMYIITMWEHVTDKQGDTHKVGRYMWQPHKDQLTERGERFRRELYEN